ncbi:ABC transporter ATP-binding protein [SAR202 cluster bacterium AD-802-E10_MRT_200m]|nr:ABC transporter ATP-binding protein [SAR202 cluster bacterium AD-802-E10_MRT_200m]
MPNQNCNESFAVISCVGIGKFYSETTEAVKDVDLTVHFGEILVLLGPSGCGKTTLLRLIAGFEEPTNGTLSVGGQLVSTSGKFVRPENRKVGMVFQDYALFPHLNVQKNIEFGLDKSTKSNKSVEEIINLVGLNHLLKRMPNELSGGEQQRTALARALVPNPTVMLFDEPLSNLDATLRVRIRAEIKDILKQAQATSIFVTHDKEEAMYLADRIAIMNHGQIEQIDSPEQIYNKPATRFVAEFMDPASFIDIKFEGSNTLITEIGKVNINDPINNTDGNWKLLLRGNNIILSTQKGTSSVDSMEFKGSHYSYAIRLESGQKIEYISQENILKVSQLVSVSINKNLPVHMYKNEIYQHTSTISDT